MDTNNKSNNNVVNVFKKPANLTKENFTLIWANLINSIEKNKI